MNLPLTAIAQSVVGQAFDLAGEIVVACVYHQATSVAYAPATGTPTPTNATANIGAIIALYEFKKIDGDRVRFGDEQATVKISEMGGIIPSPDDYLIAGSVRRNVVDIKRDPTGTVYMLQVRKAQA